MPQSESPSWWDRIQTGSGPPISPGCPEAAVLRRFELRRVLQYSPKYFWGYFYVLERVYAEIQSYLIGNTIDIEL
jgi:hypothetical protein